AFAASSGDAVRAFGPEPPTTRTARGNLGYWRGVAGGPTEALAELTALQPTVDRVFGAEHPRALRTRQQQAQLMELAGDRPGAVARLTALHREMARIQGPDHPRTREAAGLLAAWES